MKKSIIIIMLTLLVIGLSGCNKNINKEALAFKEEYESINGKTNSSGKVHRILSIDKNNPYEKVSQEEIVNKLNNNETFYLYIGDPLCPWCRSVLEKSIEVAKLNKINKIYYIDIWDDEGNEILRDKYELVDGEPKKTIDGSNNYEILLEKFDSVLSEYTLTNDAGEKISVGEKRIYAPNFIYIKNGKAIKLTEGISDKQTDSREELTEDILKDEEELFNDFFNN